MNVTNEMVELAAKAMFDLQYTWDEPFSYHGEFTWTGLKKHHTIEAYKFRDLARVALESVLGDVDSQDDVFVGGDEASHEYHE